MQPVVYELTTIYRSFIPPAVVGHPRARSWILEGYHRSLEILVVVTQCLLLPTGTHHSYTTHTVSLRGGGGGGEILVVVTQYLLLPTGTHHSYTTHTVSLRGAGGGGGGAARVATPKDCEAPINC